ncbi:Oxidoreductase [Kickxella alabastrina]|uniref:Oxidoreductase n=1 Tax=Kickxella alabastrina TaxID=61397 RepID=A0ACC1IM06_9FUNG|nr:Oxidoreductase [Kickxella alabastrina]
MSLEKEHENTLDTTIDTADLDNTTQEQQQQQQPEEEDDGSMESQQAQAFNPETGEINWDCPCLGGMAQGTCGEQFKEAFSCFVYSEEEPKGMDCIDAFKAMQQCFRDNPEEYGAELGDDDDDNDEEEQEADDGNVTDAETDIDNSTDDEQESK